MDKEPIGSIVGGIFGGVLGTAFMQTALQQSAKLPERIQPPPTEADPGKAVIKRAETIAKAELPEGAYAFAVQGTHWLYGTIWGTALGVLGPRLRLHSFPRTAAAGAVLGTGVWAVSYAGLLPALGLTPPLHKQGITHAASALAAHVVYGIITALPIWGAHMLMSRLARQPAGDRRQAQEPTQEPFGEPERGQPVL